MSNHRVGIVSRPPITFLMPVKNGEKFVHEAIQNIEQMRQIYDEVLIVDDGSVDNSIKELSRYLSIENIRIIKNTNSGLANALNLGIKEATNSLIARVDVDDSYASDRILKQLNVVGPNTVAVFSDYEFIDQKLRSFGVAYSAIFPQAVSASLITSQRTAHPSVLLKKEAVIAAGYYNQQDFPAEDLSLWLRMSRIGELISFPEVLLKYRLNPSGVSATKRKIMLRKKNDLIKNVGLNLKDLLFLKNKAYEIAAKYENFENCSERKILFGRDLILISRIFEEHHEFAGIGTKILSKCVFCRNQGLLPVGKLAYQKVKRRYIR